MISAVCASILDRLLRRKPAFTSSEQLFNAVTDLIAQLRVEGKHAAADELARGWGTLNGLTDGWALFLDAIDNVEARHVHTMNTGEKARLRRIRTTVRRTVFRRR